jgi:flavin-dependent dehydrogenase
MKRVEYIAIVGGGPAGAALATHLVRAGRQVVIFDAGKRPDLVVGESLVPAMIPLLQELGVEAEIARVSTFKPGATFFIHPEHHGSFFFDRAGGRVPSYAYNTPRQAFDTIIFKNALKSGAIHIPRRPTLLVDQARRNLALDQESLELWSTAIGGSKPDMIIDATGRSRTFAKLLGLPYREGGRRDTALFAHVESTKTTYEGHIHINRLTSGWCWRIPLPGRMSLGIVAPHESLRRFGTTAGEQYDLLCRENETLREYLDGATRVTPVMKYTNYQLTTEQWTGDNWALLGDAGGFIDPIFSSGLLLALEGAAELAQAITSRWDRAASRYQGTMLRKLEAWRSLIETFYDGRLFSMFRLKSIYSDSRGVAGISKLLDKQLALALSGVAPDSTRRLWLLRLLMLYLRSSAGNSRLRIA